MEVNKMKRNIICIFILIICLSLLPIKALAASPTATLTADGVLIDTYATVQEAVDTITSTAGSNFVVEIAQGTVTDPLNILQQPNKNVVLRPQSGATVTFTDTITIDGNGNLNNPETLLIQGFSFDFTSSASANCIYFNLIPPRVGHSYVHNVTINSCSFKGVFDTTVAVQSIPGGIKNISIINSSATDMHSLAQLKAVDGYAFIQNCIVNNSSGGVNFYGPADLFIDSCNFDVNGYAVRSGQGSGTIQNTGSVSINNSVLNSSTAGVGTIVLRGDSTNNINIIHSNITNSADLFLQNLNLASEDLYKINFIESNLTGQITGIDESTINTIDDPNVENGPICINNSSGSNVGIIIFILILLLIILIFLLISLI